MEMIGVVVNNIFNLFDETISKPFIKSVQINQADADNFWED
jgi:hypothetical protein